MDNPTCKCIPHACWCTRAKQPTGDFARYARLRKTDALKGAQRSSCAICAICTRTPRLGMRPARSSAGGMRQAARPQKPVRLVWFVSCAIVKNIHSREGRNAAKSVCMCVSLCGSLGDCACGCGGDCQQQQSGVRTKTAAVSAESQFQNSIEIKRFFRRIIPAFVGFPDRGISNHLHTATHIH